MSADVNIDHLRYQVLNQHYQGVGDVDHLKVWKDNGEDGISWDELQAVKNEVLGKDVVAVEVYPRQCDVVDELNMRHLFVLHGKVPNIRR